MPKIGKPSRVGNIGNRTKKKGKFGKGSGTVGSSLTEGQDRSMSEYPATTTTTTA